MQAKFLRNMAFVLGVWATGCFPCGIDEKQTYKTPEQVAGSDLKNGAQAVVGTFYEVNSEGMLRFEVDRTNIHESPGQLTYSLEVYAGGSPCPPDPASKLSVVGTAGDVNGSVKAEFFFSWPASLQSLDGKVLVLRAAAPAQEPTVSVICTTRLAYTPPMSMVHCSGM